MRYIYMAIILVLAASLVPWRPLTLGHVVLHTVTPLAAAVPLYLAVRAYLRVGGPRFLNLALAFAFLFLGQLFLSLNMLAGVYVYFSDIPLDHLFHFISLIFFTAALSEKT